MTMSRKKILVVCFAILVAAFVTVTGIACTSKQKSDAVKNYGEGKAFKKTPINSDYALVKGGDGFYRMSYYIPKGTEEKYKKAAEYAVDKANAVSNKVIVTITDQATYSSSSFKFAVTVSSNGGDQSAKAEAFYETNNTTKIHGATIYFYTYFLWQSDKDLLQSIAMHEIGHVFGLGHIDADKMKTHTVMEGGGVGIYTDYTEFDKYNIRWKYSPSENP